MNSIKVCEYSRLRSFHDDLILQDQASGERSQDHWSSGLYSLFLHQYDTMATSRQISNIYLLCKDDLYICKLTCS